MYILKRFNIWFGWRISKLKVFGFYLCLFIALIGMIIVISVNVLLPNKENPIYLSIQIKIISWILGFISFYLYFIGLLFSFALRNYRIYIDKAEKFLLRNPQYFNLRALISVTRKSEDSTRLREWMSNWKRLSYLKKNMLELEKKKEEIKKNPFQKIEDEIQETQKNIKDLESQLG